MNLSTGAAEVGIVMKGLPEIVDGSLGRSSPGIEQTDHIGLELTTECIKQPAVRVDLLFVALFEDKNHLYRNKIVGIIGVRFNKGGLGRHGELRRILENVGCPRQKTQLAPEGKLQKKD